MKSKFVKLNLKKLFKNKDILELALTHRSYLNEHKGEKLASNERLEFLGDAVLELIVSSYLYQKYPHLPEGKLTSMRARLVQTKTLGLAAQKLKLGSALKLSRGEKESGGENNPSIMANTFEAVIGGIYQDSGFEKACNFVQKNLLDPSENLFSNKIPLDHKSSFQELVQAKGLKTPEYVLVSEKGPDHKKVFMSAVLINNKRVALGQGYSKQEAEQEAARLACQKFGKKT
ncbi:ribonuclease III [Candidatus Beckwithbacteria bacterium CG10_big_fil_rev_8_21_14_0_10_34_10]|uniref:Ribonuclease 3 n=1 Tax=Candidatus Beckwithbacteria bacterium CG10_big_fil_rev_8_21_14_0_10_34_10 TaxID=1974495 RepID=A0A2H0WAH5_9BACT|nr:MAG: ribonuclease III [Candidatus Beckwithbacteria bacterium CG10_big_fil_rev_8_21_14_0_10_34_10]